ncbi:MAG: HIT family protein [Rhizobiales bacterium]|nr:HIT family protein [Hyphomicrobiales bacterium]
MPSYDPENIFAKILRGEIPSHKIFEDEHTYAFMDIMPQADGHALVITKAGSRNLLDADPSVFAPLMATVQKVARAAQKAFGVEGVLIKQFNEADAGQTVYHLHVHVIPRPAGTLLKPHSGKMADHSLLAEHAGKYRAALAEA